MDDQNNLLESLRKGKLKSEQISELKNLFQAALADGYISRNELAQIQFFYYDSELSENEFSALKGGVFRELVETAIADHIITEDEKNSILRIAKQLGISHEHREWASDLIQKYSEKSEGSSN